MDWKHESTERLSSSTKLIQTDVQRRTAAGFTTETTTTHTRDQITSYMDEEWQENTDGLVETNAEQINVTPEMELEKNWLSGLVFNPGQTHKTLSQTNNKHKKVKMSSNPDLTLKKTVESSWMTSNKPWFESRASEGPLIKEVL